jgi:6,7-dimethyl-8-ribityllumazine synthase
MASAPASNKQRSKAAERSVVILTSVYNATVTGTLERGAIEAFEASPIASALGLNLERYYVPGSFELVATAAMAASEQRVAAIVVLGCIVKGETNHDAVLGQAVTQQLAGLCASTGVPIGLGVLTVNTQEQALARAGLAHAGPSNKGTEAMNAALGTLVVQVGITRGESADWMLDEMEHVGAPDKFKAHKGKPPNARANAGTKSKAKSDPAKRHPPRRGTP